MELIRRRQTTGTFCEYRHPESIEYHSVLLAGVVQPISEIGPRCWIAGCPANEAAKRKQPPNA